MCLFATALIMVGCSKGKTATEPLSSHQSVEKVRQHQQFLKAAKLKKDGKWLKTEKHYSFAEAFDELGGALNYAHTFPTNAHGGVKSFEVEVSIPVTALNDIAETNLLGAYNDLVTDTRDEYRKISDASKSLLAVAGELQGIDPVTGNLLITFTAQVGVGQTFSSASFTPDDEYRYEENGSRCDGTGTAGAPEILEGMLMFKYRPAPAPNFHVWFWPQKIYIPVFSNYSVCGGQPDNYCDYEIFRASSEFGVITDETKCLGYDDSQTNKSEMQFYLEGAENVMKSYANNAEYPDFMIYEILHCDEIENGYQVIGHIHHVGYGLRHSVSVSIDPPGYPTCID